MYRSGIPWLWLPLQLCQCVALPFFVCHTRQPHHPPPPLKYPRAVFLAYWSSRQGVGCLFHKIKCVCRCATDLSVLLGARVRYSSPLYRLVYISSICQCSARWATLSSCMPSTCCLGTTKKWYKAFLYGYLLKSTTNLSNASTRCDHMASPQNGHNPVWFCFHKSYSFCISGVRVYRSLIVEKLNASQ